jgi:hypothetical protein
MVPKKKKLTKAQNKKLLQIIHGPTTNALLNPFQDLPEDLQSIDTKPI